MNERIEKILKEKVIEACGCTEPIAVAYASAIARSLHEGKPQKLMLCLSANVIKNAMIVCLPGTGGKYGIPLAGAMGALYGDSSKELNVIAGLNEKQIEECEAFSQNVTVKRANCRTPLYIEAKLFYEDGRYSVAVIKGTHTNIARLEVDGKEIKVKNAISAKGTIKAEKDIPKESISISEIFDYASGSDANLAFADKIISINKAMSDEGLKNDYGLCVGKTVAQLEECKAHELLKNLNYILERTTAGVDARMAGASLPVMSNSGSGNQGLIATLPVIAAAEALGFDKQKTERAVLLSSLIAIFIKSKHSVLSAYCGAVIAATGVAAALTYMLDGSEEQIKMAIQNSLGNTFGVLCDGAKETCSLKVANCTFSAVYSAYLALKQKSPKFKEGVICDRAEDTIDKIALLGKKTSGVLDKTLIELMLK